MLDELDRELGAAGRRFVRYADCRRGRPTPIAPTIGGAAAAGGTERRWPEVSY